MVSFSQPVNERYPRFVAAAWLQMQDGHITRSALAKLKLGWLLHQHFQPLQVKLGLEGEADGVADDLTEVGHPLVDIPGGHH